MAVYGSPKRKPMQGQCHRACWCVHRAAGQVAHNHSHSVGTYAVAKIISTVKRKAKGMHYLSELAYVRKRTRLRRRAVKLSVNLFVGEFGRRRLDRYSISCSLIGKSVVVLKLFWICLNRWRCRLFAAWNYRLFMIARRSQMDCMISSRLVRLLFVHNRNSSTGRAFNITSAV